MSGPSSDRLTFFFPKTRILSASEVAALPEEKKKAALGQAGVWLEVDCPKGACVGEGGRITLAAAGHEGRSDKGLWLNVFCPEESCLFQSASDLP
jgi:hypothetical protein